MDPAGLVRAEWGFEAPAERSAPPRPARLRRAYAWLWWAVRPRSGAPTLTASGTRRGGACSAVHA